MPESQWSAGLRAAREWLVREKHETDEFRPHRRGIVHQKLRALRIEGRAIKHVLFVDEVGQGVIHRGVAVGPPVGFVEPAIPLGAFVAAFDKILRGLALFCSGVTAWGIKAEFPDDIEQSFRWLRWDLRFQDPVALGRRHAARVALGLQLLGRG